MNFFKDGKWKCITIDKYLPVNNQNKLIFAKCEDENEFWVPLAEKAFAKLHGSYFQLIGGHTHEALVDLTGGVGYQIKIKSNMYNSIELWEKLNKCNEDEYLMGASISSNTTNESEFKGTGLLTGHAYGLLKCVEINKIKLIHLR